MLTFVFSLVDSVTITIIALLALGGVYRLIRPEPGFESLAAEPKSVPAHLVAMTDCFEVDGLRAYTHSKASSDVNYDFFDVQNHFKNVITFYLGDVSGKGTSAAHCLSACRSLLKHAARISLEPAGVVSEVNETLSSRDLDGRYATLLYGSLDLSCGRLRLLSAGHPNPIRISRSGQTEVLECSPCLPVGILTGHGYSVREFILQPGDTLLLYTDGITEARDTNKQFFGEHKLMELGQEMNSTYPCPLVERIVNRVEAFSRDLKDDQTVMAITYVGLTSDYSTRRMEVNPSQATPLSLCYN